MDEVPEFLKKLFKHMHVVEMNLSADKGSWVNVAKLSPEDMLKKKDLDMRKRRQMSQAKVLSSKLQVIYAIMQAEQDEFWDGVYGTYSLPANLPYKVDDQGQVVKYVPAPPSENA